MPDLYLTYLNRPDVESAAQRGIAWAIAALVEALRQENRQQAGQQTAQGGGKDD